MELCKEYKSLNCLNEKEKLCESFDLEFQENLPQYLDDIERVVKCSVKNVVTDYETSNQTVKLYGKSIISLTYVNNDNCRLSNIFEEDFSKSFDLNSNCEINFAKINLNTKYSNFRLVNQRRIDIHISLKANITAFAQCNDNCLTKCDNAFLRNYNTERLVQKASGICSEEFDETINLSESQGHIKNIINTFTNSCVIDKKIIKDKMLVRANVEVSVLYESDNGQIDRCSSQFQISKIVDICGADEEDTALVTSTVSSIYVKAKADSNNNLCSIEAVGKVTFNYQVCSIDKEEFVIDSYMASHDISSTVNELRIKSKPTYYYDENSCEIEFKCDRNIVEIFDLKSSIESCEIEDSRLIIKLKLSFLYLDDSSQLYYYENEEVYEKILSDIKNSGTATANQISYDYVIKNANCVAVRLNFEYSAYLYSNESISYISNIEIIDKKQLDNSAQLTLYFAKKDENVWDIAKKFSTDVTLIMEENDLTSQVIDTQRVLLVPGM